MKGKRPSQTPKPSSPFKGESTVELGLLLIDERPLRTAAFKAFQKAERQVARARDRIETFESRDLPAFSRWDAQVFGSLMTELRDATSALREKLQLLALIDEEVFWTDNSRVEAYRRVIEARENPTPPPEPKAGPDFEAEQDRPKVFGQSDLPPGFDIEEYDRMSLRQQKEVYEVYEDHALLFEMINGLAAPQFEDLLASERAHRQKHHASAGHEGPPPPEDRFVPRKHPAGPSEESSRIKQLYRILVRLLHPDMGGARTAHHRDLWQQVQDAYASRDIEWLEAIHGRLEGLHQGGAALSIQTLRRLTDELLSALHGLRTQIVKLRRHPAWNFQAKTDALAKLEAKRRRALETQLARQRKQLRAVEKILGRLAALAAKGPQSPGRKRASAGRQQHFQF